MNNIGPFIKGPDGRITGGYGYMYVGDRTVVWGIIPLNEPDGTQLLVARSEDIGCFVWSRSTSELKAKIREANQIYLRLEGIKV